MTLERDQDLVFDAEGWEAERFIAEVIRAERGLFPMRKRDPRYHHDLYSPNPPCSRKGSAGCSKA